MRVGATTRTVTVGGTVPPRSDPYIEEFSHPDPVELFGHSFVGALRTSGVEVANFARERNVASGGRHIHTVRTPITGVLPAILLDSNNAVTDQLFYLVGERLGGSGTRSASAKAIDHVLKCNGIDTASLAQVDGSGLSRATRGNARLFSSTLRALNRESPKAWRVFLDFLPRAGQTGTLSRRMRGTAAEGVVRGKTGWISGASALSGVVLNDAGEARLAFSILVNYPRVGGLNTKAWKPMQDAICAHLADAVRATKESVR